MWGGTVRARGRGVEAGWKGCGEGDDGEEGVSVYDEGFWNGTALHLATELNGRGALPAIFFHYDRTGCNALATAMYTQLVDAEQAFRATDTTYKSKLRDYEKWVAGAKDREREKSRRAKQKKTDEDVVDDDDDAHAPPNPDDPDARFSFVGEKCGYTLTDLKRDCEAVRKYMGGQEVLVEVFLVGGSYLTATEQALQRGIGVHHAGCNRRYLQLVEMLFRRRFLNVIIATGTLALGINMPCKTVVFVGDSVFLTALGYRQASGRAGRRGFDQLGTVVFHGCPLTKVNRLILSRLPDITGHFPMTTTLVLRLLQLILETNQSPQTLKAVEGLLGQPFLYLGGKQFKDQVGHHLRFSIEYLRREGLIDATGRPVDMAGCVSHLYYTEPANFAFAALFRAGIFNNICANLDTQRDETMKALLHILCHLFGRRPRLRHHVADTPTPAHVLLKPLPQEAVKVLRDHDARILTIYRTYIRTFVSQHGDKLGDDNELPLSGIKAVHDGGVENDEGVIVAKLRETALPYVARSAFVAVSGVADDFKTTKDLVSSVRRGVFLEASAIPSMSDLIAGPNDPPPVLDAYLLNFFTHGQVSALIRDNGLRRGDIWFMLDAFHHVLLTLKTSLEVWLKQLDGEEVDGDGDDVPEEDAEEGGDSDVNVGGGGERPEVMARTRNVDDATWRVYRAFVMLQTQFEEKFVKMWA
ncbi:hypothetical protein HK104_011307 [Borealophlyctis nickersoniae]|nr:hypothetical protein HK104_011307 [Borealophlyctis nickersoniae]